MWKALDRIKQHSLQNERLKYTISPMDQLSVSVLILKYTSFSKCFPFGFFHPAALSLLPFKTVNFSNGADGRLLGAHLFR